jgi:hypothetical protein
MRTLLVSSSVAALAMFGVGYSAQAANVTDVQGQVQISQSGGPFKTINGPAVCNAGDVVRANKDGSARVVNASGAIQDVLPGKPVTCRAATAAAATTPPAAPGAAAGAAGAAGASTAAIVGGTIAVAAGVAGVIAVTNKKSSSP